MSNPMQYINFIMGLRNPEQYVMDEIERTSKTNPMVATAYQMMCSGNVTGLERLVRNICKERGIDADQLIQMMSDKRYQR